MGTVGCGMRLVDEFFQDPSAELDASCLDRVARPPFFLSNTGPYAEPGDMREDEE